MSLPTRARGKGNEMLDAAVVIGGKYYRYAQEKGGQQLHLVEVMGDDVSHRARCGRHTERWRATFNLPLAHACKNCWRTVAE